MRTPTLLLLLLAALALAAAGCGGGEEVAPLPQTVEDGGGATGATDTEPAETDGEDGTQGDPAAGKEIFASSGCGSCHTLADAGASGAVGPNLDEAQPSEEDAAQVIANGRGAMPAFEGQLDDDQIQDVAAYVASATGR